MYIPFNQLPPASRLWVFQANRALTADDISGINSAMQTKLAEWAAHGHPLLASARVVDDRFLLVAVDENAGMPSGCSIDSMTQTVQAVGNQLVIDFMDRSVTYLADGEVQSLAISALKSAFATGLLTPETLVFNTLVTTVTDYQTQWRIPASQTWLKRYIKPVTA